MAPRTGRPIKGPRKRDQSLQIRMTQDEMDMLDDCATRLDATRTDIVVRGISLVRDALDGDQRPPKK